MVLSITEVARIAAEAARSASPALTVTGVTVTGGSGYSEIFVCDYARPAHPHSAVGVFRNISEAALRAEIIETLRRHLDYLPAG
jgi:hypothetical protein